MCACVNASKRTSVLLLLSMQAGNGSSGKSHRGMSRIEAARGEYSAYRLVVYVIIIVIYLSSCARVNIFFGFLLDSFSFVFIRARTSAGTVVFHEIDRKRGQFFLPLTSSLFGYE